MRLIFAGTPDFAVPMLEAVFARHDIAAVLTQPDRPRGRSLHLEPTPVKAAAERLSIPVMQPETLRDPLVQSDLRALGAQAIVVVAYGRILPKEVLDLTPSGCINVHPSLLPAYRGAAPIQRAIMNGETQTGVSIMKLDEGMDTGPIYAQSVVPISPDETAAELAGRLDQEAARLLLDVLDSAERGRAAPTPQPDEGVSIADKIGKDEARIEWRKSAREIHNVVRALNPIPGAFTTAGGRRLKVWRTVLARDGSGAPGEVVSTEPRLEVGTGAGDIVLVEVQPENKARMAALEFVRGYRPSVGDRLGDG